jgi:hypothetical protein
MPIGRETILRRLGAVLHAQLDDIPREPLPRRWVDLIHHLEEQERRERERQLERNAEKTA